MADDELGRLYVNEADFDLWRYGAEPGAGQARVSVDQVGGGGHLEADVEGLTLVDLPGGTGYLIASSQGDDPSPSTAARAPTRSSASSRWTARSRPTAAATPTGSTPGPPTSAPASRQGMFVCQDHHNGDPDSGNQNFKYVRWKTSST